VKGFGILLLVIVWMAPASARADLPALLSLQLDRQVSEIVIEGPKGRSGRATLTNLNPSVNAWYLLTIRWGRRAPVTYHLENPHPLEQWLRLDPEHPDGLSIESRGQSHACTLWAPGRASGLERARESRRAYVPLCGNRLLLRNPARGQKTSVERVTDILRRHVPGGEAITAFVRDEFWADAFLETGEEVEGGPVDEGPPAPGTPPALLIDPAQAGRRVRVEHLGILPEGSAGPRLTLGRWYRAASLPGVSVAVVMPGALSADLLASERERVADLDETESQALVTLVAFDLARFELGYALGTEHPGVEWSTRVPERMRDERLPGPDGLADVAPLVRTGLLAPGLAERVAATFVGGFKRYHGAFRSGSLAWTKGGSHYGFVEQGVVLSRLQPGLATLVVGADGQIDLRTWREGDEARGLRFARQNGLALVEPDPAPGQVRPGALVRQWGRGNWSGSPESRIRTVRAALGLVEAGGARYLVFGYFSAATPSGMARVFQAMGARYALQLDINALEHTYLAVYRSEGGQLIGQTLVRGMQEVDRGSSARPLPRWIGAPDNRDFFYLLRKPAP